MAESKHTTGAIRAARMIYETHKIESMTMPCFGEATDQYIQNIAGMIDQATGLPELKSRIDRLEAEKAELVEAMQKLLSQFEKWEGYHQWDEEDENVLLSGRAALAKHEPVEGE